MADASVFTAEAQGTCPGTEVSSVAYGAAGSITFNADLTYVAQGWEHDRIAGTSSRPLSCTSATSCAELSVSVRPDDSFLRDTCSGTTVCACSSSSASGMTESGTYVVTGTQLDIDGPDHDAQPLFLRRGIPAAHCRRQCATGAIVADAVALRQ